VRDERRWPVAQFAAPGTGSPPVIVIVIVIAVAISVVPA